MDKEKVEILGEAMMKMAMGMIEQQNKDDEAWLSNLEKNPSSIGVFERGLAIADFKGEAVRQRHLATLAKNDAVRETIEQQANFCDTIVARLERLPLDGAETPTVN